MQIYGEWSQSQILILGDSFYLIQLFPDNSKIQGEVIKVKIFHNT